MYYIVVQNVASNMFDLNFSVRAQHDKDSNLFNI